MSELRGRDERVKLLFLARNFGHQLAISAGLDFANGDAVVIIDGDLQDPPEVVLEMIPLWREGYEVVHGVRRERAGEGRLKLWTAHAFYRLMQRLSDVEFPLDSGDFRLLDLGWRARSGPTCGSRTATCGECSPVSASGRPPSATTATSASPGSPRTPGRR
jgi:glycosyltransferase involved in cell wall biosynthesis